MIIKDLNGRNFEILNLNEFKHHILKYHTKNGLPDGSIHKEDGYYFRVDIFLRNYLLEKNLIFN